MTPYTNPGMYDDLCFGNLLLEAAKGDEPKIGI